jgi:SAM-dependent methyltransferase
VIWGSDLATSRIAPCTEDLERLAAAQYQLADRFCDSCRNYHALWPYRRIARIVASVEASAPYFSSALVELFKSGRRRLLIAGAADTGLLALAARAGSLFDVDIAVLDRCRTPLELCREFAQRWSLAAAMRHEDLNCLDAQAEFDVVIMNSTLLFIAAEQRVDVLSRLRRALRPDGRLVHVFNVSARISGAAAPQFRAGYSGWIIDELKSRGIPLPESEETFICRLHDYAREFESREGTFSRLEDVVALQQQAGFTNVSCVESDLGATLPWKKFVAKLSKRRYVVVAEPTRDGGNR